MFNNWSDLLPTVKKAFGTLGKSNPKMVKAYMVPACKRYLPMYIDPGWHW